MTTKELNIYYAGVLLQGMGCRVAGDEHPAEQFSEVYSQFRAEMGWLANRKGELDACTDWLQGLALGVPYYYQDIENMIKETGADKGKTAGQIEKMVQDYWRFLAVRFLWLTGRKKAWFDKNGVTA